MTRRLDDFVLGFFVLLAALAMCAGAAPGCEAGPAPALSQDIEAAASILPPGVTEPVRARSVLRGLTQADVLLAAQACVHENSWQGGVGGTFDCGAQIQVFLTRRLAHEPLRHVIERLMPRFAAGTTSRSWVHGLPWGHLREDPPGWPALYPARHDDDRWHAVAERVVGFLRGREPLPCASPPEAWFGRYVDHEAIEHRRELGWVAIDCNPGGAPETETLELYMARP